MSPNTDFKKIIVTIFLLLLISSLFVGCIGITTDDGGGNDNNDNNGNDDKQNTPDQIIEDISNEASYQMVIDNVDNENFVILDVRTEEEFNDGHIENAINIDFYSETFTQELDKLDKAKKYLIYCRSAKRSGQAMPIMEDLGFQEVYNMLGGIVEWEDNGYPIVT
jgi:rhodanese-related sulfurtransferase